MVPASGFESCGINDGLRFQSLILFIKDVLLIFVAPLYRLCLDDSDVEGTYSLFRPIQHQTIHSFVSKTMSHTI